MKLPNGLDLKPVDMINALSRDARKNYYIGLFRKILEANPEGVNVTELERELNQRGVGYSYNRKTMLNYLSQLVGTREAYYETIGNTLIFKPNGKLFHAEKTTFFVDGENNYVIFHVENPNLNEKQLIIQERQLTSTGHKVVGGIMIPEVRLMEFIGSLEKVLNKE